MGPAYHNGRCPSLSPLCSERMVPVPLPSRGDASSSKPVQLLRPEKGTRPLHESDLQSLCRGMPHEHTHLRLTLGEVHRPRVHILSEMRRGMSNQGDKAQVPIRIFSKLPSEIG